MINNITGDLLVNGKCMDRFIKKHCKLVIQDMGEPKAHVVFGTIHDVDHSDGFLLVEEKRGFFYIEIKSVIAIKPTTDENH